MVLSIEDIRALVLNNPDKSLIAHGRAYSTTLRRHLRGVDKDETIPVIDGFERASLHETRRKYSKTNKDIFSRLSRPIDKVFSARGGSVYYNLSDASEKSAAGYCSNVADGYPSKKWTELFWTPHFLDDPYGVVMMEVATRDKAAELSNQGLPWVYPTYKSSGKIISYKPKGNGVEYIMLSVDKKEKKEAGYKDDDVIYRIVDDAFDYWVKQEGDNVRVLSQSFPNLFGYCPCMRNSDIIDPEHEGGVLSLFDPVIELAEQYLLKGSVKVSHDLLHGFPKYVEFASVCDTCNGTAYVDGKPCPTCKGTGKKSMIRPGDVKQLNWPDKDDALIKPGEVGAYISPDKTYWEIATSDLGMLEDLMTYTIWGVVSNIKTQGPYTKSSDVKTATQVIDEIRPQSDRLEAISDNAQGIDKFIRDSIITVMIQQQYKGASVQYGRRYMLESPDKLKTAYEDSKAKNAPISVLDDLLQEYIESKYASDPAKLAVQMKLAKVEPFVHWPVSVVQTMPISDDDKAMKIFFSEWKAQQLDAVLLTLPVDMLRNELSAYAKGRVVRPEPTLLT